MFFKVMSTFTFLLVIYTFFIVAFGLAFFIMLHDENSNTKLQNKTSTTNLNNKTMNGNDGHYVFFDTPWLALLKTSIMFVGEMNFEDLPIHDVYDYLNPLAYLFFLSFVFLIVLVLMNLLNGLAVSDVAKIEDEAEFWVHSSRLEVILQIESIFVQFKEKKSIFQLQNRRSCCGNWIRGIFVVPDLSCCTILKLFSCFKTILNKNANQVLIFNSVLENNKYTMKPNKEPNPFEYIYLHTMDETIINDSKKIISEREIPEQKTKDEDETKCKITNLERKIINLENNGHTLANKIENIEKLLILINNKLPTI